MVLLASFFPVSSCSEEGVCDFDGTVEPADAGLSFLPWRECKMGEIAYCQTQLTFRWSRRVSRHRRRLSDHRHYSRRRRRILQQRRLKKKTQPRIEPRTFRVTDVNPNQLLTLSDGDSLPACDVGAWLDFTEADPNTTTLSIVPCIQAYSRRY